MLVPKKKPHPNPSPLGEGTRMGILPFKSPLQSSGIPPLRGSLQKNERSSRWGFFIQSATRNFELCVNR